VRRRGRRWSGWGSEVKKRSHHQSTAGAFVCRMVSSLRDLKRSFFAPYAWNAPLASPTGGRRYRGEESLQAGNIARGVVACQVIFDFETAEEPGERGAVRVWSRVQLGAQYDAVQVVPAESDIRREAENAEMLLQQRRKGFGALGEPVTLRWVGSRLKLAALGAGERLEVFREQVLSQFGVFRDAPVALRGVGDLDHRFSQALALVPFLERGVAEVGFGAEGPHRSVSVPEDALLQACDVESFPHQYNCGSFFWRFFS
jgi:hypothetical protein